MFFACSLLYGYLRTFCVSFRTFLRTFIASIWMGIVTTNLKLQSVISKNISNIVTTNLKLQSVISKNISNTHYI